MARISPDSIREFIKMYDKQDEIIVENDFRVWHRCPTEWARTNVYECKDINSASELVNCIIFDLPINAIPA